MEITLVDIENAEQAIKVVANSEKELSYFGYRHPDHKNFSANRAELFQQFTAEEFVRATVWLEDEVTNGRLVRARGSYTLKHEAEDATRGYISNGVLIAAAISLGLKVVRVPETPNAMISIAVRA